MFNLVGFFVSLPNGSVDTQIPGVADDLYNRQNNSYRLLAPHKLLFGYAGCASMNRARINNAELMPQGQAQLVPFNAALLPPNDPNVSDWRDGPIQLSGRNDLRVDGSQGGAGAENAYAVLGITPYGWNQNINHSNLRWVRFTAAITATATAWSTPGTLTPIESLEGGRYTVYGMQAQGTTIVAARLIFPDQQNIRPGCLGQAAVGSRSHQMFRGGLGRWGSFDSLALPQLQVLCNAADTAQEVYILMGAGG